MENHVAVSMFRYSIVIEWYDLDIICIILQAF